MNTIFLAIALSVTATAPDTVVVCPPAFEEALRPWLDYRRSQGHVIQVISSAKTAAEIRTRIRACAASGQLTHVLLVGDAPAPSGNLFGLPWFGGSGKVSPAHEDRNVRIPAHYVPSIITRRWGSEPLIATDNDYADLDDDLTPDLALGRLTADTPHELAAMIQKIIAYEHNTDFGSWRTRVNFVAGAGGFGALADGLLERVAGGVITRNLPATYASSMTYGCWHSAFCPHPNHFRETVVERLNEGCAFWVYIGHGSERNVAGVSLAPRFRWDSIFSANDVPKVNPRGGPPIALFLACKTGAYDKRDDCLAEELLRSSSGPVAVIGGSRVTMPYAMTVLGLGMMTETFTSRRATLGEVFLHAKRRLLPPATARGAALATILAMSKAFESLPADGFPLTKRAALLRGVRIVAALPAELMQERREHVALFNLFGDPLLRLRHPAPIELIAPPKATAGRAIAVSGAVKVAASPATAQAGAITTAVPHARIEILTPRERLIHDEPERQAFDASRAALAAYDKAYRRVNGGVIATALAPLRNNQFRATIPLPEASAGRYVIRVAIESPAHFAAAASEIYVEPATSRPPSTAPASTARANSPVR